MSDSQFTVVQGEVGPPPLFTPEDVDFLRAFSDPNYPVGDSFEMWAERAPRFLALSRNIQQWLDQQPPIPRHTVLMAKQSAPYTVSYNMLIDETDLTEEG